MIQYGQLLFKIYCRSLLIVKLVWTDQFNVSIKIVQVTLSDFISQNINLIKYNGSFVKMGIIYLPFKRWCKLEQSTARRRRLLFFDVLLNNIIVQATVTSTVCPAYSSIEQIVNERYCCTIFTFSGTCFIKICIHLSSSYKHLTKRTIHNFKKCLVRLNIVDVI